MGNSIEVVDRPGRLAKPALGYGAVVAPAADLAGVHTPDGGLVPPERLGPGVVLTVAADGICVHWLGANLDAWVARDDVRPLGAGIRLVTVRRCDPAGHCTLLRHCPIALDHHWQVDLLPKEVIRAVRPDGACWTFTYNSLTQEVDPLWLVPLTDEGAEAIVAADMAMAHPQTGWRAVTAACLARLRGFSGALRGARSGA